MMQGLDLDARVVPAAYVRRWVELLAARDIAPERVLAGTGLTHAELADPTLRLSLRTTAQISFTGVGLARDPAIGLAFGLSLQPTSHGSVGLAAVTAHTTRDALAMVDRYGLLRSGPWHFRWEERGDRAAFTMAERVELGPLRLLLFDFVLGGFCRFVELVVARPDAVTEMEVTIVDQVQPYHLAPRIPRIRRGERIEIEFPAAWLDLAMPLRDPVVHREAIAALESERAAVVSDDPVDRIRALLAEPDARFPSLEAVAARLGLSSRSLRRHLHAQGTDFQTLRDEARHARAATLLTSSMLAIDQIADALGYARPTGFTRAFRRWAGMSPSAFRERARRPG